MPGQPNRTQPKKEEETKHRLWGEDAERRPHQARIFPLPVEEAHNIGALLLASAPYAAVDPCVGDGTALIEITRNTGAHPAGIELDTNRAAAAAERGIVTLHGSVFECWVLAETCSLLYLNPPYDCEFGPHSDKRMELVFLEHCYRWVITEGGNVISYGEIISRSTLARILRRAGYRWKKGAGMSHFT